MVFYYQDEHLAARIVGWSSFGQLLELMQSKVVSFLVALCQVHLQPPSDKPECTGRMVRDEWSETRSEAINSKGTTRHRGFVTEEWIRYI